MLGISTLSTQKLVSNTIFCFVCFQYKDSGTLKAMADSMTGVALVPDKTVGSYSVRKSESANK